MTNRTPHDRLADDLIYGAKNIGAEIGATARQAYHMLEAGHIPGFKMGAKWVSRRSKLRERVAEQEKAAGCL